MINSNLDNAVHKSNGIADWGNDLNSIWLSDKARPWDVYSKEKFTKFWDVRYVEHRA